MNKPQMETARRNSLHKVSSQNCSHPGLWLDRYLFQQIVRDQRNEGDTTYAELIKQTIQINVPDYQRFFARWEHELNQYPEMQQFTVKTTGRMIVGLGDESVIETSIRLHHTYGVPYIPGSALKGLAAYCARMQDNAIWGKFEPDQKDPQKRSFFPSDVYRTLFGDTDAEGYIRFFDALIVVSDRHPLAQDIITVHHPGYYRGDDVAPADWDNPTPIPFISASGTFLIALAGPKEWTLVAKKMLEYGLKTYGIGAKTSSGYGRLE